MGTLAAGIKEIFATAKTTGSNVMLCGNDGTPDGHMTMANLASVLGVIPKNKSIADFNQETTRGLYYSTRLSAANSPNIRGEGFGILLVQTFDSYGTLYQVFFDYDKKIYARNYNENTWGDWVDMSTPSYLRSYSDLSSLANALGVGKSVDYITHYTLSNDANDFTGKFLMGMTDTETTNIPVSTYGFLINFHCGGSQYHAFGVQIWIMSATNNNSIFVRRYWNGWRDWYEFSPVS